MNQVIKHFYVLLCALLVITMVTSSCENAVNFPLSSGSFPDFSNCNCDFSSREFVCTPEGLWFRSACFATCVGYNELMDQVDSCSTSPADILDTLSWPIRIVCHPIEPLPPIVATLSDNTVIFALDDGSFIRGVPEFRCRCLPPETGISTPTGIRAVSSLNIGDEVYTQSLLGETEIQTILKVNQVPVNEDHQLLHICLADGRELALTPEHPAMDGRPLNAFSPGDLLDGSTIQEMEILPYPGKETWDILPAGETGIYKADGIWIGSTLISPAYEKVME